MRTKKTNPGHVKTRLYGEVEKALRSGASDIIFSLPSACGSGSKTLSGARRKKLVAAMTMGDRVLFFDPELNPELSYAVECGVVGQLAGTYPELRYEGRGLHSLPTATLKRLFLDGKAFALVPLSHRLALAM